MRCVRVFSEIGIEFFNSITSMNCVLQRVRKGTTSKKLTHFVQLEVTVQKFTLKRHFTICIMYHVLVRIRILKEEEDTAKNMKD